MGTMQIIGKSPLAPSGPALFCKGPGTVFPARDTLVTVPGIHATQRMALVDHLNALRTQAQQPHLTSAEAEAAWTESVDLFFEEDGILIRPDPDHMPLAFEADELLQTLTSKHNIKFLQATNERVGQAIKERGECWRISPLPKSIEEIKEMIRNSRTAIGGASLYYHNRLTGTRFLTCDSFQGMREMPFESMARHLEEIRVFSLCKNRLQQPEIAFFQAAAFGPDAFAGIPFPNLNRSELMAVHADLARRFAAAVPAEMRRDDVDFPAWRNAMFTALVGQQNERVSEEILQGLSPEYFLQIEWLPGCRTEKGELLFDSIFNEFEKYPNRQDLADVCDWRVKNFIFNFTREYGELDYVNVARLPRTLSRRAQLDGRRGVYLAEIKPRHFSRPIVRIIRMQKWDVGGHLDNGRDLLGAMLEAAEYSDYVLDRRLACRQLGMNLPQNITMLRLSEAYGGSNDRYRGQIIWSTYFERDYFVGIATDKVTPAKLELEAYAVNLAHLLGKAAASNMIVGRLDTHNRIMFDDGDEIIREEQGLPSEILIADPTGAFGDYQYPLADHIADYALPVTKRWRWVNNPQGFAEAYWTAFAEEFQRIQKEYRYRRRAFDSLFHHRTRNVMGSFAYRWEKVLERLDRTDLSLLGRSYQSAIAAAAKT